MSTQNLSQEMEQDYEEEFAGETLGDRKAAPFRIFTVLLFLLTLGGLFLGMIPALQSALIATSSTALDPLNGSLAYVIWAGTVRSWIPTFKGTTLNFNVLATTEIVETIISYLPYLLFAGLVIALVAMVIGLCSRRAAKPCMYVVFYTIFITFLLFFLFLFVAQSVADTTSIEEITSFVEPSSAIIAGIALVFIVCAHLARGKKFTLVNTLLLVLVLGATFGLFYPESSTVAWLIAVNVAGLTFDVNAMTIVMQLIHVALAAVIAINLLVLIIRLGTKKGILATAIISCLQFVLAVATVILTIVNEGNDWALLGEIAALVLLICSLAVALVSVLCCIFPRNTEEEYEEEYEEYEDPVEEAAPAPAATPAPAYIPTPVPAATPYVGAPVVNYIMPAPGGYVAPMYTTPAPASAPAVAPVVVPAPVAAPAPSEEMTEFEKHMAALAKGEPIAEQQPATTPIIPRKPLPFMAQSNTAAMDSKYIYDPFIYTLTDAEKNEFGNLFIAGENAARNSLPTYVIGGDNKEFFAKVFIYLGKFRSQISGNLLAKIYNHVNR